MRDFLPAIELFAKAVRSGLAAVGALVDCGIPRQHAGAQWLTAAEEEIEVWPGRGCGNDAGDGAKQPVVGAHILESPARPGSTHCSYCPINDGANCQLDCIHMMYGFDAPQDSRTNAGATSSRAVEETSEGASPPAAPSDVLPDSWVQYVIPAITDVLASHVPTPSGPWRGKSQPVACLNFDDVCAEFGDMHDWRDHVAPLIAARLEAVTLALPEM